VHTGRKLNWRSCCTFQTDVTRAIIHCMLYMIMFLCISNKLSCCIAKCCTTVDPLWLFKYCYIHQALRWPPSRLARRGLGNVFLLACQPVARAWLVPPCGELLKNITSVCTQPHCFEWAEWCIIRREMYSTREKLTLFPYGQDIVGNVFLLAFWWCSQVQDRIGGLWEMYKNVTFVTCKIAVLLHRCCSSNM